MTNRFTYLASITENADFRRVCNFLAQMRPGEIIDESEVAFMTGLDKDTTMFILDWLFEASMIVPAPPSDPVRMAA